MSDNTDKMAEFAANSHQAKSLAYFECAEAMCRYCHGAKGHEAIPIQHFGRWEHLFTVGNGSNPCAAGPIWSLIEKHILSYGASIQATAKWIALSGGTK